MPPNQNPQQNPYDFIMNPAPPPKKSLFSFGSKKGGKLGLVIGLGAVLIIVALLGTSLLSSGQTNNEQLLEITQQQQEIIRVAGLGKKVRGQATINLAANTSALITSSQQQVIALMGKKDKPSSKELTLKKDTKTDKALLQAEQTNQLDEVFTATIVKQVAAYQKDVKKAYDGTNNKKSKDVLKKAFNNAQGILNSQTTSTQAPN